MRALVVFHGRGEGVFARFLDPGFRHCFVCVLDPRSRIWIRLDGRAGLPELRADAAADFALAGFFRASGFRVVELDILRPQPPRTPLMLGTCVGAVKRVIGLNAPFVLTPRQLFRRLT
tara:strand:- start:2775 stop:3128 length:354 start_codon:yes stop_codon:yes gene_type:complete